MGTKLHPPYPNWTSPQINTLEFRAHQCLKCGGLWGSLGIGRFRCLHSSLMQAIRCANLEHSALNAGVPTDPHSPESNSSYLAQIWSIRELYSLCASCTVIKKTGLGMIRSDKYKFWVISMLERSMMPNRSDLCEIYERTERIAHFYHQTSLKLDNSGIQDSCRQRSKDRLANYANELSGKWLEILREPSHQKMVCEKSNFCKIQGMSKTSEIHAACCILCAG